MFAKTYEKFLSEFNLERMGVIERWETHKCILKEAATVARDYLMANPLTGDGGELMLLNSIARAVAKCDVRLATRLLMSNEMANDLLVITDGRRVQREAQLLAAAGCASRRSSATC